MPPQKKKIHATMRGVPGRDQKHRGTRNIPRGSGRRR